MSGQERVAVVTGGGGDIGRAIAVRLANDGHKVAIADLDLGAATAVSTEINRTLNEQTSAVELQVSDNDSVVAAVEQVLAKWGRIDILVNNAGITRDNFLERLELEQWNEVIGVNLTGSFLCAKAVAPIMRENRYGRVVNISSVAGVHGALTCVNYCASKAGVLGLTAALAREFGRYVTKDGADITCNAVMPGIVDTKLSAVMPDAIREQRVRDTPLGRFGEPKDVADVVSFFSSEDSRFVTGTALRVDGGLRLAIG
jgi:3-oxoacyl-[acyl-carrier protein] reductase